MTATHYRRLALLVAFFIFLIPVSPAQTEENHLHERKNTLSFTLSVHNFFDGHGMFSGRPEWAGGYEPSSKGVRYKRQLGRRWAVSGSFRHVNHYYWDAREIGDIAYRWAWFFEANLYRRLVEWKGISAYALIGIGMRTGSELTYATMGPGELHYRYYRLNDPYANAGLSLQYELPANIPVPVIRNLVLFTDAKYSLVLHRYTVDAPSSTYDPNLSTRRMLTWTGGIGYRF